jgi:hypothetical protein
MTINPFVQLKESKETDPDLHPKNIAQHAIALKRTFGKVSISNEGDAGLLLCYDLCVRIDFHSGVYL